MTGMGSTATKEQIQKLPEQIQTSYPDAWQDQTFQSAVRTLQGEMVKLHDAGLDVTPLSRAVIELSKNAQQARSAR